MLVLTYLRVAGKCSDLTLSAVFPLKTSPCASVWFQLKKVFVERQMQPLSVAVGRPVSTVHPNC